MKLSDIALILGTQPITALLDEGTGAELFYLKSQLTRWLDLTERELSLRYPAAILEGNSPMARLSRPAEDRP
jgi:hypothetical protein